MNYDLVDLKADILGMIAGDFGLRQVDKKLFAAEFPHHEEPAVLLNIYRAVDLGDRKPIARVRIDVTVEEIDDRR